MRRHRLLPSLLMTALCSFALKAQQIDLGMFPTAVPDSFEFRMKSTAGSFNGVVNASFTVRWDTTAGGTIGLNDVGDVCNAFDFFPSAGVIHDGAYAYYTVNIFGLKPPSNNCIITPTEIPIGGLRIRDLSGCRKIALVNDSMTSVSNRHYYISFGGVEVTGNIYTQPFYYGDHCPPCTPPQIISAAALYSGSCTSGSVSLGMTATGTDLEYLWYEADQLGIAIGYQDSISYYGPVGAYYAVVQNDCGIDSALVVATQDTSGCVPPEVLSISHTPWACSDDVLFLEATTNNATHCSQYTWTGPVGVPDGSLTTTVNNAVPGTYQLVVTNACGSDTVSIEVALDTTACVPPAIDSVSYGINCLAAVIVLYANVDPSSSCPYYNWTGPGDVPDGSVDAVVHAPQTGTYQVVASNACGADTASVFVDLGCSSPVIDSIQQSILTCADQTLDLSATVTTTTLASVQYHWTGPVSIPGNSPNVTINNAQPGIYQLAIKDCCGADTAWIEVALDTAGCVPPIIDDLTIGISCPDLWFFDITMGPPLSCPSLLLAGPNGWSSVPSPTGSGSYTALSHTAPPGDYALIATNSCGADTAYGAIPDTTCIVPTILSLSSNSPVCEGDTLILNLETSPVSTCTRLDLFMPNGYLFFWPTDTSTTLSIPNAIDGEYRIVLSNSCGADTMIIDADVVVIPFDHYYAGCLPDTVLVLNDMLGGHTPGGSWTFNGQPHDSIFDPAFDVAGDYYYYEPNSSVCPRAVVTMNNNQLGYPGADSSITVCETDAPFDMFNFLGGDPDPGGQWVLWIGVVNPIFDPAQYGPGVYTRRYGHLACGTGFSTLTITVLPDTATWYMDIDGDGLGDGGDTITYCFQPNGYVGNADDDCPLVFGTIGSPCDDGFPGTINDSLDVNCNCVGEISTGISAASDGSVGFVVWPNPNNGDVWNVLANGLPHSTRRASFELFDLLGEVLLGKELLVKNGTLRATITPANDLRSGVYLAKLKVGDQEIIMRLMKQ